MTNCARLTTIDFKIVTQKLGNAPTDTPKSIRHPLGLWKGATSKILTRIPFMDSKMRGWVKGKKIF